MSVGTVTLLILGALVAVGGAFALGLFFAGLMHAGSDADASRERAVREQQKVREAFRCAVAQMTPLKGGRDMPAEEVMRQQLLDHMWRHHGGITVLSVPKAP